MKKNSHTLIIALLLIIFILIGIYSCLGIHFKQNPLSSLSNTNLIIPSDFKDLRDYSDTDNWFGEGYTEVSFILSSQEIVNLKEQKPFGSNWVKGPYIDEKGEKPDVITIFKNIHQIKNSDKIYFYKKYKFIDRLDYDPSYEIVFLDIENNILLFQKLSQ